MGGKIVINTYDDFRELVGKTILTSAPIEITKERIQQFCLGTLNEEWIHWDEERCKQSPLGDIIAPGLYLPALFPKMFWDAMEVHIPRIIVKGIDRIRILSPVTVGSEIIGTAIVENVIDKNPGIEVHYGITFFHAQTKETAAVATFLNRYWGLEE